MWVLLAGAGAVALFVFAVSALIYMIATRL